MNGKELANYAVTKKNTPYFYGSKMKVLTNVFMATMHKMYPNTVTDAYMTKAKNKGQIGVVNTDCSGLISGYTNKILGSAQLYSQAYARMPINTWKIWAPGVVLWKSGHVGVYIGNGKVIEARGIDYGTVETDIEARGWSYGLTFSWMDYTYDEGVPSDQITYKKENPYKEPTKLIVKGSKGDGVKWLQYELIEAGYNIGTYGPDHNGIDGQAGSKTISALTSFQQSAKIQIDGICGPETRKALKAN